MNRFVSIALVVFCALSLIAAGGCKSKTESPAVAQAETLHGDIIDNHCSTENQANLAVFVKSHTKECALMPACSASGYSIFTADGKLIKFDQASNGKIIEFLNQPESKLQVEIQAKRVGDELSLVSIKNLG
jgi:hypothetical protein